MKAKNDAFELGDSEGEGRSLMNSEIMSLNFWLQYAVRWKKNLQHWQEHKVCNSLLEIKMKKFGYRLGILKSLCFLPCARNKCFLKCARVKLWDPSIIPIILGIT